MLRSITWQQFQELLVYHETEAHGEEREDYRLALLASVITAAAGIKSTTIVEDFLKALSPREEPVQESKQTVEQMEMHLRAWTDAANVIDAESKWRR
jgi:2-phospho-L-lactate guanylyltransferase (CobY/MobA/RfbA family)